jgi:nicotinate-nucleotide adenylyltransferase
LKKNIKFIIYGGSFNPIHTGHVSIISFVLENKIGNNLIIIPAGNPPHKHIPEKNSTLRLEMLKLVLEKLPNNEKIIFDDWECKNDDEKNYTIDTLNRWQKRKPEGIFDLLIGSDSLSEFYTWKDWKKILKIAGLLVSPRLKNNLEKKRLALNINSIKKDNLFLDLNKTIDLNLSCFPSPEYINNMKKEGVNLKILNLIPDEISSSQLRNTSLQKEKFQKFIPDCLKNNKKFLNYYFQFHSDDMKNKI